MADLMSALKRLQDKSQAWEKRTQGNIAESEADVRAKLNQVLNPQQNAGPSLNQGNPDAIPWEMAPAMGELRAGRMPQGIDPEILARMQRALGQAPGQAEASAMPELPQEQPKRFQNLQKSLRPMADTPAIALPEDEEELKRQLANIPLK